MSFSFSSLFDCLKLLGKGIFSGIELEEFEFGLTLVVWDSFGALRGCGKVLASLAVAFAPYSSSCSSFSSLLKPCLDGFGGFPSSLPLLNVMALVVSKFPFGFTMVELGSLPCSQNCPRNSEIYPICFFMSLISFSWFAILLF